MTRATPDAGRARLGPIPLGPILEHLRSRPPRTWSIIVTVFGDAVMPRGGSLWLGSLLEILAGLDIGAGAVRTAMSRLVADGWLHRRRLGRNSFYALTETGRADFEVAAAKIYGAAPGPWDGAFAIVLGDGAALAGSGFGSLAPGVWIAPAITPLPPQAASLIQLEGRADALTGPRLAARVWDLDGTAGAYRRFLDAFEPLRAWTEAGGRGSPLEALTARTLLVHEYRRVILRDPLLPHALLPPDWPGFCARELVSFVYRAMLSDAEAWLDAHGQNEAGTLPGPSPSLRWRFGS